VAHACNPSYSGGRGQEDHSSKPARGNSSRDPISKNRSGEVAQGEGLSSSPSTAKKERKKSEIMSFAGKLMELEISMVNEINQSQEIKCHMFLFCFVLFFMCGI
jgi:hypothetical protein